MDKKEQKKKLIIKIVVSILFFASLGISYAYLKTRIGPSATTPANLISNTVDRLFFTEGSPINLLANQQTFANGESNLEAATTTSATLIANDDTKTYSDTYNVYFNISENGYTYSTENKDPEIILKITDPLGNVITSLSDYSYVTNGGISGFDITEKIGSVIIANDYAISSTDYLVGTTQNWTFQIYYINLNVSQNQNAGKKLLATAQLQKEKLFFDKILANNGGVIAIEAKGIPDFSKVAVSQAYYNTLTESTSPKQSQAVVENGMYAAPDDYGTSYYFRGAVDNNWVKFANKYWRIIRINGDGSVRMIYTGTTAPTESQKVVMTGTGTQIATSKFNSSYNNNMYVGYMYTSGGVHGLGTSSTIKGVIDDWYESNLSAYSNSLADNLFCNDRSAYTNTAGTTLGGGTGTTKTYYGAYIRNYTNKQPILTCPTQSDAFTATDTTKGNGALDYPIGLITADEMAMAGGVYGTSNPNFYLYTNKFFWSFSPSNYNGSNAIGFSLNSTGNLNNNIVNNTIGVRAVVSLKSDVDFSGSGLWNDPYEVKFTLRETILANNGGATSIEARGTPNFAIVATTNEGMYAAQDDYGTSYYFRGAVDNNWVKFANMYWRIIRINGDGSVRMIYTGTTAPTEAQKVVMTGTGTQISESAFNSTSNDNMYVGYMYTSGEVHGLGTPSTIKGVIDDWYESNLSAYSNSLADNLFCNDRSAYTDYHGTTPGGGTGTTDTDYGAYIRNVTYKQPILTCPTQSDAFTVTDTIKGNGTLNYPIGLVTLNEMAMAGGVCWTSNPNFYLYTNQNLWLLSPSVYIGSASNFYFYSDGGMGISSVNYTYGVRPVVSLKSDILITGSGTWNDPYIVL